METLAKFQDAIEQIENGATVLRACDLVGMTPRTFYKLMQGNPDLRAAYDRAREIGFETQADKLMNIHENVRDPLAAKVLSDNIKWLLSKRQSSIYGDKLAVAVNHAGDLTQILKAAIERIPLAPGRDQEKVIDAENVTISDIFGDKTSDDFSDVAPLLQIENGK